MEQNINLAVAFFAGLGAFFSPCLFPLLPAFISMIAGQTEEAKKPLQILPSVVLFVLGFTIVFSVLGVSASFAGSFFIKFKFLLARISGVFIIILGLAVMGVIKIPFLMREKRPVAYKGGGLMLGIAFGLGWSPCIGLVLANILIMAGSTGTIVRGITMLSAFCLGLGLPFIIFGTLFSYLIGIFDLLKKYHKQIYSTSGFILVLTGLLLLTGKFSWLAARLQSLF